MAFPPMRFDIILVKIWPMATMIMIGRIHWVMNVMMADSSRGITFPNCTPAS